MDSKESSRIIDILYRVAIVIVIFGIVCFTLFRTTSLKLTILDNMPNCYVEDLTGLFCPGCGTTRAVKALLDLKFVKSFLYNVGPIMIICFLIYFIIKETIHRLFAKTAVTAKELLRMVYIYAFTMFFQWTIKVILFLGFHIKML